jgi:uncharacterized protein (TIGR00369 family)
MTPDQIEELVTYLRRTVSFSNHIGLRIEEVVPGRAVFSLDVQEMHMNGAGSMHGGVHAAVMDSAMAVALIAHGLRVTTTNMNLTYLAGISKGRVLCTGEVIHLGRRNAVTEARMHNESGDLLAVGSASFRIFEREVVGQPRPSGPSES